MGQTLGSGSEGSEVLRIDVAGIRPDSQAITAGQRSAGDTHHAAAATCSSYLVLYRTKANLAPARHNLSGSSRNSPSHRMTSARTDQD